MTNTALAPSPKPATIRVLNDRLRKLFLGGRIMLSAAVAAMEPEPKARLLQAVREFDSFDADNDPYNEHDCFLFDFEGERYAVKIDLYEEPGVNALNGEPVVARVLTIMLAEEY